MVEQFCGSAKDCVSRQNPAGNCRTGHLVEELLEERISERIVEQIVDVKAGEFDTTEANLGEDLRTERASCRADYRSAQDVKRRAKLAGSSGTVSAFGRWHETEPESCASASGRWQVTESESCVSAFGRWQSD